MMRRALGTFRTLSIILALLISLCPATSLAAATNYEQQYELAAGMLYDLRNHETMTKAQNLFAELGAYKQSSNYVQYLKAVSELYAGHLDEARAVLYVLSMLDAFSQELQTRELPSCQQLDTYGKARQAEEKGDRETAWKLYLEAPVLDAVERMIPMSAAAASEEGQTESQQDEGESSQTAPAEEAMPESLTLSAANISNGISLSWNSAGLDAEYSIYWKRTKNSKDPFTLVAKTKETSYQHIGTPHARFKYTYYVAVETEGSSLTSNQVEIVHYPTSPSQKKQTNTDPGAVWEQPGGTNPEAVWEDNSWDNDFNLGS